MNAAAAQDQEEHREGILDVAQMFGAMSLTQKASEHARKLAGDRSAAEEGLGRLRALCEAASAGVAIHAQEFFVMLGLVEVPRPLVYY